METSYRISLFCRAEFTIPKKMLFYRLSLWQSLRPKLGITAMQNSHICYGSNLGGTIIDRRRKQYVWRFRQLRNKTRLIA